MDLPSNFSYKITYFLLNQQQKYVFNAKNFPIEEGAINMWLNNHIVFISIIRIINSMFGEYVGLRNLYLYPEIRQVEHKISYVHYKPNVSPLNCIIFYHSSLPKSQSFTLFYLSYAPSSCTSATTMTHFSLTSYFTFLTQLSIY